MKILKTPANLSAKIKSISNTLVRWFPTPRVLVPYIAGIDISEASIKWIVFEEHKEGLRIFKYGSTQLSAGIVIDGLIRDEIALAQALKQVKSELSGINYANAALPEESAYVFSVHVPEKTKRDQIMSIIEFELDGRVPISPKDAVFDYDIIMEHDDGVGAEIGVVVFPREVVESYISVFNAAGFELQSLEVEARSIARAVSSQSADEPIMLTVDFGRGRTGLSVLKRGVPIFTSTVKVGGEAMTKAVIEKLSLTPEDAERFKNDQGLLAKEGTKNPGVQVLFETAAALADEVAKLYRYWDTRRNDKGVRMTPVGRVLILGGNSNLKGLANYIAERVQAPTFRPDLWQNVCSFEKYIPPIDRKTSLQYATAIGLALRGM